MRYPNPLMVAAFCFLITACTSGRTTLLPNPDSYRLAGILELSIDALYSPPTGPIRNNIQYKIDLETKEWGYPLRNASSQPLPCRYTLQGKNLTIELVYQIENVEGMLPTMEWRRVVVINLKFRRRDGNTLYGPFQGTAWRIDVREDKIFDKYRENEVWNGTVTGHVKVNPGEPEQIKILPQKRCPSSST